MRKIRLCTIAAAVTVLALTAHTAPGGKGGGKNEPLATLTFDDLSGDAIQSDGLGPYDVSVTVDSDVVVSLTNKQEIWLDFSDCDPIAGLSCEGPFGPDTASDYVAGATINFPNLDWESGVTDRAGVSFFFQSGETRWKLLTVADITPYDDDDDGTIDRWTFEHDGTTSSKLLKGYGQRRGAGGFTYEEHGRFFMPWGATIQTP